MDNSGDSSAMSSISSSVMARLFFFCSRSLGDLGDGCRCCLLGDSAMVVLVGFTVISSRCLRSAGRGYAYVGLY